MKTEMSVKLRTSSPFVRALNSASSSLMLPVGQSIPEISGVSERGYTLNKALPFRNRIGLFAASDGSQFIFAFNLDVSTAISEAGPSVNSASFYAL